jgi:hypothetical protein
MGHISFADDVNLLGDNMDTIKKNTEVLIDVTRDGLEVTTVKTKCMLLFCHQHAGQNHNIMTANRSFENVAKFIYLE